MNTIEDAAREHCNIKKDLIIDEEERYYKDFQKYDGFKAGAEFAQRWIPVEEELPEKLVQVIVKLANGWHTTTWITENGDFAFNVKPTHWRQIELK